MCMCVFSFIDSNVFILPVNQIHHCICSSFQSCVCASVCFLIHLVMAMYLSLQWSLYTKYNTVCVVLSCRRCQYLGQSSVPKCRFLFINYTLNISNMTFHIQLDLMFHFELSFLSPDTIFNIYVFKIALNKE